jgi:hypothetical protein
VTVYDPVARAGRAPALPARRTRRRISSGRAHQPFLFGDFGIADADGGGPGGHGVQAPRSRVTVVGGAQMMASVASAQIGKRNVLDGAQGAVEGRLPDRTRDRRGHSSRPFGERSMSRPAT